MVKKSRTQPPPQRRVKDATVLQEKNRAPVSSVKQKEYKVGVPQSLDFIDQIYIYITYTACV